MTDRAVERRIRELRDAGELTGLPGEGAPLPADPDAGAGEAWAARHLVRASRAQPKWLALRVEIAELRSRLAARLRAHERWLERRTDAIARVPAERILLESAATRAADERARTELAKAIDEVNSMIRRHNLLVPSTAVHIGLVTLQGLVAAPPEERS